MDTLRAVELEDQIFQLRAELLDAQQQLRLRSEPRAPRSEIFGMKRQESVLASIWQGLRAVFSAGIEMFRKGLQKLRNWASTAGHTVKLVTATTKSLAKVVAKVLWRKTKSVAEKVWNRGKAVWEKIQPELEAFWVKAKMLAVRVWETVVAAFRVFYEKAIAVAAWLAQKMQQLVEATTVAINRLAEFLGKAIAYGVVLVIWAGLQFAAVYHSARETVRREIGISQPAEYRAAA